MVVYIGLRLNVSLKVEGSPMIYYSPHKEGRVDKIKTPPNLFACNVSLIAHHILALVILVISFFIRKISTST